MADPYWKYTVSAPPERSSNPIPSFPGYLSSSEASTLTTHRPWSSTDVRYNSDILQRDLLPSRAGEYPVDDRGIHPPAYPVDDVRCIRPPAHPVDDIRGVHNEPGLGRLTSGASIRGYPSPLREPSLLEQRRDVAPGISPGFHDINYERPSSHKRTHDLSPSVKESNILFVDGLPTDCSRREVGHLFRPFIGFRELRVVHKEPRRSGDKPVVLCFVEFTDSKCALTAMEALQGYKFDDKKPSSGVLEISFAHFPFRLPSDRVDQ